MAELLLGNIKPAGDDNIVVDSKYIKGGYTTVSTIADRNALSASGQTIIKGSLCYVATGDGVGFYQYNGSTWVEANLGGSSGDNQTIEVIVSSGSTDINYTFDSTACISWKAGSNTYLSVADSAADKPRVTITSDNQTISLGGTTFNSDATVDFVAGNNVSLGWGNAQISIGTSMEPSFTSVSAQTFVAKSDARLKENFVGYTSDKSILDLPVYTFDFIDGAKNQLGCKAQDLQEICPEIVNENENGYLSIQESKIVYLLLEEVKNLTLRIAELEAKCETK